MTERKVRWGIMSTASIGKRSTIPGIQESTRNVVAAVASRSLENAKICRRAWYSKGIREL